MRWAGDIAAGKQVLDLACGRGRNARWLAARGAQVLAIDRDAEALATLEGLSGICTLKADLEDAPWPLADRRQFDAVVVCRYLHRPLFPKLFAAVLPGGRLIYETFMFGNERYGRPSRPEFLLEPGELRRRVTGQGWHVEGEREGLEETNAGDGSVRRAVIQAIAATRPA